jgi:hypothetical protein
MNSHLLVAYFFFADHSALPTIGTTEPCGRRKKTIPRDRIAKIWAYAEAHGYQRMNRPAMLFVGRAGVADEQAEPSIAAIPQQHLPGGWSLAGVIAESLLSLWFGSPPFQ